MISAWTADHVQQGFAGASVFPLVTAADARPAIADLDLWDSWPVQNPDGSTALFAGYAYWFMLSAPKFPDPGQRHNHARIRLLSYRDGCWIDCGNAMPDGFSPGLREWAGSAVLEPDGRIKLYFTAAGRRGQRPTFEQRLFSTTASLTSAGTALPKLANWTAPEELIVADGQTYVRANQREGMPGAIKAFRDPAFFQDPADGQNYILFTGSAAWSEHEYNGLVGIAALDRNGAWAFLPPLISSVGLNNELERPHILVRDGRYYLFWSTQRRTFDPAGPSGPNGLYAAVADSIVGPWIPVNGSGLVAGNPDQEPLQCYSWWVTGEGMAAAFVDHWGLQGRSFDDHPELLRTQFGGTPAPQVKLTFDGDRVGLVV